MFSGRLNRLTSQDTHSNSESYLLHNRNFGSIISLSSLSLPSSHERRSHPHYICQSISNFLKLKIADDVSSYEYHKHLTSNFSLVIIYRLLDTYCHFLAFPYLSQKSNFIIFIKKYWQQFHEYSRNLSHNRESQNQN